MYIFYIHVYLSYYCVLVLVCVCVCVGRVLFVGCFAGEGSLQIMSAFLCDSLCLTSAKVLLSDSSSMRPRTSLLWFCRVGGRLPGCGAASVLFRQVVGDAVHFLVLASSVLELLWLVGQS